MMSYQLTYVAERTFEALRRRSPDVRLASLLGVLCRINCLYMISLAGSGHIGTSFSSIDPVLWLYLTRLRRTERGRRGRYFSSKGHDVPGLYSILVALGDLPFGSIHGLRRLGGMPGHPDVGTPGIQANTGSLGMGISKAKGFALAARRRGEIEPVYVLTGDGELQEGQFWESLQPVANLGLSEITVIIDHNKVQSDMLVSSTSDLGDLERKLASFGWDVARSDGHDFAALEQTLQRFERDRSRPHLLIADTVKGAGVSFMAHTALASPTSLYRYHSGAPSPDDYLRALAELSARARELDTDGVVEMVSVDAPVRPTQIENQRQIPVYEEALTKVGEQDPRIVVLDADLYVDCGLATFRKRFPDRFIECGIAEQHMVSTAGALALAGLVPFVHSFACFLSTRPNEQIYNNATEGTKVVYVGSLAGLLPAGPGHSHQSVRDISALGGVPGLIALQPADQEELRLAVDFCANSHDSVYLRLSSVPWPVNFSLPRAHRLEIGRGRTIRSGSAAAVIAYGPVMLTEAVACASALATLGIELEVIDLPWLNRVDGDWLASVVARFPLLFHIDDHYATGGQGDVLGAALAASGLSIRLVRFAVDRIPECGQNQEVLAAHGLDRLSLERRIAAELGRASPHVD